MNSQLTLLEVVEPAKHTIPLRVALEDLAALWSLRLGDQRIVTGNSWAGYTISRPRAYTAGVRIPPGSETKP